MSQRGPYPLVRPYYKGHSREEDEKLAKELFYGTSTIDKKTSRSRHDYLLADSPDERRAFEALRRLMLFSCQDLDPAILEGLLCSLDSGGSFERRLVFQFRKKGKRSDFAADLDVAAYVGGLIHGGQKKEAAVKRAEDKFGLKRKAVFAAIKRFNASWLKR